MNKSASNMKILITGGTGFIGRPLCHQLDSKGYELWVLTRNKDHAIKCLPEGVNLINSLTDIDPSQHFNAVINLAGEPIAKRWTSAYKQQLFESRVNLTHDLINMLKQSEKKPDVLISGSAVGYYGSQADNSLTESSSFQLGFCHDLCQAWEDAANKANGLGIRVCCLRTGVVIGKNGGILQEMRLPFLLGLGGPVGSGQQWMSWIHLDDMIRVIIFCLENPSINGAINATAPNPVTNKEFANAYAQALHRPAILTTPGLILKLLFGQMADEILLSGQKVIPLKLIECGFVFNYPELKI